MNISFAWLQDILKQSLSVQEVADRLSVSGLEVEHLDTWESLPGALQGFVIGEVLTCAPHPDADRLSLTTVNIGQGEPLSIVCGAPNVAAGQKVVVATVGTLVSMPGKEPFEIKKSKIRGAVSEGMICAEDEMGVGSSHDGILVLPADVIVGTPAADYFGVVRDTVMEIGLTANRGDAASHLGVARDVAALFGLPLPTLSGFSFDTIGANLSSMLDSSSDSSNPGGTDVLGGISPKNNADVLGSSTGNSENGRSAAFLDFPRKENRGVAIAAPEYSDYYIGVTVSGVQVGASPEWLQHRLRAIGIEPKNNVVDATNYVLHHTGQPVHAFDAACLNGAVSVRFAAAGERLALLDGREIELSESDLVIADATGPQALAGIMGGSRSAVSSETTEIFLEIAHFHAGTVRKSAKRHVLNTDASFRFERGIDRLGMLDVARFLSALIVKIAGGTVQGYEDVEAKAYQAKYIDIQLDKLNSFAGMEYPIDRVRGILSSLGFSVSGEAPLTLEVPSWRNDVSREVDVYEEIMRIYGYDAIPMSGKMQISLGNFQGMQKKSREDMVRNFFIDRGFYEAQNNSLVSADWYPEGAPLVHLSNPLSADMGVMRMSLVPGLLQSIAYNQNRQAKSVRLFEMGRIYEKTETGYKETPVLTVVAWGDAEAESWESPKRSVDFFDMKRWISALLQRLDSGLSVDDAGIHSVSKAWLKKAEVKGQVVAVEIPLKKLLKAGRKSVKYQPVSKFFGMRRDLSLVVEESVPFAQLQQLVKQSKVKHLSDVKVFDVFEGAPLEAGKKSISLSFFFNRSDQTMLDADADKAMEKLMETFESNGALIRR